MKKTSKLLSVLIGLFMVISLFVACGKDDSKDEDKVKDNDTVQADDDEAEESTDVESATENVTELDLFTEGDKISEIINTTKVTDTTESTATKAPGTSKVPTTKVPTTKVPTTKVPTTKVPTTKVPTTKVPTTKVPTTIKADDKNEENNTSSKPITMPDATEKEENKSANVDLLAGTWETTIESDGLPVTLQFVFEKNGTLQVDFTRASYDKMIKKAVDEELSQITDEELVQAGFSNIEEAEAFLYELLEEEASYDDLRALLKNTGKWFLSGDTLTITMDGESVTAQTKLSQGKTSFVIQDTTGEFMTLTKV